MNDPLFTPLQAGAFTLANRLVMSPLTRCRAGDDRVPNDLMVEYYAQRASFGMILTEATSITPQGVGYPGTPGIWTDAQIDGWKKVTEAVHQRGGLILLQLWHVGRVSDPIYLDGELPVAPSAIASPGHVSLVRPHKEFVIPRALEAAEIPGIIEDYRKAAENAMAAGFDGVELHGANGYLLDQFLQSASNLRTDEYGGSIENRARLLLEVTDAVSSVWGADRVGVHLAPRGDSHGMGDPQADEVFHHAARELGKRGIAFLCSRESYEDDPLGPSLKRSFGGVYIANEKFDAAVSRETIHSGGADAIAFGKSAIANPDLVERFRRGAALNEPDPSQFYGTGAAGYTDYPFLED